MIRDCHRSCFSVILQDKNRQNSLKTGVSRDAQEETAAPVKRGDCVTAIMGAIGRYFNVDVAQ